MGFSRNNIMNGPARIYIGTTVPATGAPPTWVSHTNGVPGDGVEVGYTESQVEFSYKTTKVKITPEQSYMAVDAFISEEVGQVVFTAMEVTYTTLKKAFDNTYTFSDSSKYGWSFGNSGGINTPFQTSIFFSTPQRRNSGKYIVGMLYAAISLDGVKLPFTKSKPTSYQVTMDCIADASRTAGDQGGQFYIES